MAKRSGEGRVRAVTAFATTGLREAGEPDPWMDAEAQAEAVLRRPGLLPEEFWKARPVFGHIRQAAHSRVCSGDVLFWAVMARTSGMLSHRIRAETGVGNRASLNIFASPVGAPGAGKSSSAGLARKLMPAPDDGFPDGMPLGTGEGIAEAFMGEVEEETGAVHERGPHKGDPVTARVRKQVRHNIYFYVDEGSVLSKLGERSASTLYETLRSAAFGEGIGQTNATADRIRRVQEETYSMGLLIGYQPATVGHLMADASAGTPQRFFWCWAADPSIPDDPPPWPGQITDHPGMLRPFDQVDIEFPDDIKKQLRAEKLARGRGEVEALLLDGHASLMKIKAASMFALFDGRFAVAGEDWELAEMAWESSCLVRDALIAQAEREAQAAKEQQESAAVLLALRTHDAKTTADLAVERLALQVLKRASVPEGITIGALRKAVNSRDRPLVDKSVAFAEARGWVAVDGDGRIYASAAKAA